MPTLDGILLDIAPEMEAVDPSKRERLLGYASKQVGFGDKDIRNLAIAYLAAHEYTLSQRNGAGGAVSSETEGDLSRTYSFGMTAAETSFGLTSYGQEFERLKRIFIFKPTVRTF